jgi:hypothetical protein
LKAQDANNGTKGMQRGKESGRMVRTQREQRGKGTEIMKTGGMEGGANERKEGRK